MKCPKCGQDNLEFKMVCGYCGTQLRTFQEKTEISNPTDDKTSSHEADLQSRLLNRKLVNSEIFGFFFRILPILLGVLAYVVTSYLIEIGEVPSPYILVVSSLILLSLMIFAGSIIFNEGWSLESMESPIKGAIAVLLCCSLLFVCIFGSTAIFESTSQYRNHDNINTNSGSMSGVIENWKIDAAHDNGISGDPSGVIIRNVLIHSSNEKVHYSGIALYDASECEIENCIFIDLQTGINMMNCSDIVIRNCIFSGTTSIALSDCKNIDVVDCVFGQDYYILASNCSNIYDESNVVKDASQLPKYSDFLFPTLASVAEAIIVILFIVWLFLFGWLRGIRPGGL